MEITSKTLVADIASQIPAASDILRGHGIDPEILADTPLGDAIEGTGLSIPGLVAEIRKASLRVAGTDRWPVELEMSSPDEIVEHIMDTYHVPVWKALDELGGRLSAVLLGEGDRHPELYDTGRQFERLRTLVRVHMENEETVVFPALLSSRIEDGATAESLARLETDHPAIMAALRGLRQATLGYQPPPGAGTEWLALYRALRDLEHDMMRHIRLEDDRLIPAVRERQSRS